MALAALVAVTTAHAEAPSAPRSRLAGIIHPLDWGASHDEVFGKLKTELDDQYRDEMKTSDTIKIDRLIRKKAEELKLIRKSLVRFDGQRTGYETSLLSGEVLPRENESLIRVDDRRAQRYYIFRNEKLWKVVVTYNVSSMGAFADFIGQVRTKYQNPKKASFSDDTGERRMTAVTWEDDHTRLVVEDRSDFYSSYVMKFVQVGTGTELETARANRPKARRTAAEGRAEGMMADIFDGGDNGAGDDLVDAITGSETTVDLESGRPTVYEAPQMADDVEPVKKKSRKKKRSTRKKAPKKAAEPAIIY